VRHETYIVADEAVPRPLREEAEGEGDSHAPTVARCLEQGEIVCQLVDLALNCESLADLSICEIYKRVPLTAIGVVSSEDSDGIGILSGRQMYRCQNGLSSYIVN
jgi:hypothetical protein